MDKIILKSILTVMMVTLLSTSLSFGKASAQVGPAADIINKGVEAGKAKSDDAVVEQAPKETKGYRIPIIPRPDGLPGLDPSKTENPEQARAYFLGTFLPRVTQFLLTMMSVAAFVMLLYAGFIYFSSFGDSEKAGEAKNIIIYAVVGLVVAMLSFAIVQIISSIKL